MKSNTAVFRFNYEHTRLSLEKSY